MTRIKRNGDGSWKDSRINSGFSSRRGQRRYKKSLPRNDRGEILYPVGAMRMTAKERAQYLKVWRGDRTAGAFEG